MKLVWSKSTLPLSVLIRAITGEDCSHFSFVFESAAKGVQFESNLLGTHPKFWANSKKDLTVVHEKNLNLSIEVEDQIWDIVVEKFDDRPYDYLGVIYLGWRLLLERLFGIPRGSKNKWAQPGMFACDQVYDVFNTIPGFPDVPVGTGMDTPLDVWHRLKEFEYKPQSQVLGAT